MVPPGEGNEARGEGRRGVGVSHSTAEAGELSPRDPVEGRGHRQVAPVEGKTANTPRLGPVSTSRHRIAELARQALGMAVAIAWLPGPAGTRRRVAKPSVEEPDAAEPARPDLWGARVSNDPGLPDRSPVTSASPSDGCRPGGRGDLLDEPPRPACVDAPLAQRLGPHQRDAAIITPHRLVAQRASAVLKRADVHARTSPVRVPAPALFERCSTNRCRHVPSGSTCGRRLRTYATGSIAVPSPPHIPLACRAHQSECG